MLCSATVMALPCTPAQVPKYEKSKGIGIQEAEQCSKF